MTLRVMDDVKESVRRAGVATARWGKGGGVPAGWVGGRERSRYPVALSIA